MRVHGKRILIRQDETASESKGGIALPEQSRGKLPTGEILETGGTSVSDHTIILDSPFKVGDKVLFTEFGGVDVMVDGEKLMVVDWEDVLLVLEEKTSD